MREFRQLRTEQSINSVLTLICCTLLHLLQTHELRILLPALCAPLSIPTAPLLVNRRMLPLTCCDLWPSAHRMHTTCLKLCKARCVVLQAMARRMTTHSPSTCSAAVGTPH